MSRFSLTAGADAPAVVETECAACGRKIAILLPIEGPLRYMLPALSGTAIEIDFVVSCTPVCAGPDNEGPHVVTARLA